MSPCVIVRVARKIARQGDGQSVRIGPWRRRSRTACRAATPRACDWRRNCGRKHAQDVLWRAQVGTQALEVLIALRALASPDCSNSSYSSRRLIVIVGRWANFRC
jgi:hypothetical protein